MCIVFVVQLYAQALVLMEIAHSQILVRAMLDFMGRHATEVIFDNIYLSFFNMSVQCLNHYDNPPSQKN